MKRQDQVTGRARLPSAAELLLGAALLILLIGFWVSLWVPSLP